MSLLPVVAAVPASAKTSASALVEPWSLTLWGASEPHTVTQLSAAPKPRSTWSGAHGLSASFSARQYEYFPGWPSVARSSRPGRAPPTFWRMRRTARPMTALARWPWPSALAPALIPRRGAIGPLTIRSGVHGCVVVWIAFRLKRGSASARIAATTTGRGPGRAPAGARLAASASRGPPPRQGAGGAVTAAPGGARGPGAPRPRPGAGGGARAP